MSTSGGQTIEIMGDEFVSTSTYQAEVTDPTQLQPSSPYIMSCTYRDTNNIHCTTVPGVGNSLTWTVRDVTSGTVISFSGSPADYEWPFITSPLTLVGAESLTNSYATYLWWQKLWKEQ